MACGEAAKDSTMEKTYAARRAKAAEFLRERGGGAAVFIDSEESRDVSARYLCGHPSDAILILYDDGYSTLVPWDENLAAERAFCDKVIPYAKYKNEAVDALRLNLSSSGHLGSRRVELPPSTPYPSFIKYIDALQGMDVVCNENGTALKVREMRMTKDDGEISRIREAARIGDLIIDEIEKRAASGKIKTETDAAMLIERALREHGGERTGFDTLAAGPSRSRLIHCFPCCSRGEWPGEGLSILDFGVVFDGYTSDTTLTIAKGKLSAAQEKIVSLVQRAYDECLPLYKPGLPVRDADAKARALFAQAKMKMPHTLGHGIGLEIHESPRVSEKTPTTLAFKEGMVVTLEPGLYDESAGGCRLENDVLITKDGNEVLTRSRIIRLP